MAARELLALDEATPQIIAPQAGDTAVLPITLNQATGNEVALNLAYTTNKATSGNDTGLVINQTDTASPGTSLLADFQVGGVSKFSIDNTGKFTESIRVGFGKQVYIDNAIYGMSRTGTQLLLQGQHGVVLQTTSDTNDANLFSIQTNSSYAQIASSGVQTFLQLTPTYNQTGTAGATDLLINRTETAVGSGTQLLMDLQVGSSSKLSVNNAGVITSTKTTADEAFINFVASADADATSAISTLTTSGAVTHHIQIEINGTTAWIPCSTTDPT